MHVRDFEAERDRLTAVAARILGSGAEAEDVVQDAWLRLTRTLEADRTDSAIEDLAAWLTTVVTRLCLDRLRRRRTRSETVLDTARPAVATADAEIDDPEADLLLAEQVGVAMQLVIESLAPGERAAFVLHDVFGYPFEQIGPMLGRSVAAVRQLASRGRRKVRGQAETGADRAVRAEDARVVEAFLSAAHGGDLDTLLTLLAPDAVMRADLVGRQTGAAPIYQGAGAVAARFNGSKGALAANIDGDLGAAWFMARVVKVAFAFHVSQGRIREIELIADPDVLSGMDIVRRRPPRRLRSQREKNPESHPEPN